MALKNEYLHAIIMYEFWKGTKIDAIKSICAFGEPIVIRTCKSTQTSNAMILTSRISLVLESK